MTTFEEIKKSDRVTKALIFGLLWFLYTDQVNQVSGATLNLNPKNITS